MSDPVPVNPARNKEQATEEEAEFRKQFLTHYERISALLTRVTGNRSDAEDLATEVFLRLSRRGDAWLLRNNVGGWLHRTATHLGIDLLRSRARRSTCENAAAAAALERSDDTHDSPLTRVLREQEGVRVRRALSKMKPLNAQMLLMRANGDGYREIAETLEVSVASVGTLLVRAEAEFKKRYLRVSDGGIK